MTLTTMQRSVLRALGYRFVYDDDRKVIVAEAPPTKSPPLKTREFSYD